MTATERKLAGKLLQMTDEHYSNHGCNDLDLIADCGLTEAEGKKIATALAKWIKKDDPQYDGAEDPHCCIDWMVMQWMSEKLLGRRRLMEIVNALPYLDAIEAARKQADATGKTVYVVPVRGWRLAENIDDETSSETKGIRPREEAGARWEKTVCGVAPLETRCQIPQLRP